MNNRKSNLNKKWETQ